MNKEARSSKIKTLKEQGYKPVSGFSDLFINPLGQVYSLKKGKHIQPSNRNCIYSGAGFLSIPKLVLQAFRGQKYRSGQITYIDGNKANTTPGNLKYSSLFNKSEKELVNYSGLLTAIRCYFAVSQKYKVKNSILTRIYLNEILIKRGFYGSKNKEKHIEVFKSFMEGFNNNHTNAGQLHGLSVRDSSIIINKFTNTLINEVLTDLENGNLSIQEYQPKPKTQTEVIRKYNELNKAKGMPPIPLRRKSTKEVLREWDKYQSGLLKE
jgi:hypothetical protein